MAQHPRGYDELNEAEIALYNAIVEATNRPWAGYVTHRNLRDVGEGISRDLDRARLNSLGSQSRASTELGRQQYGDIAAKFEAQRDEIDGLLEQLKSSKPASMKWEVYS